MKKENIIKTSESIFGVIFLVVIYIVGTKDFGFTLSGLILPFGLLICLPSIFKENWDENKHTILGVPMMIILQLRKKDVGVE